MTGPATADDTAAIVLLPGMRLDDLSPDGFQDTWGADCPSPDRSADGHRRSEASLALSIASGCRSSSTASSNCSSDAALEKPVSGSPSSSVCGGFDWDEGDKLLSLQQQQHHQQMPGSQLHPMLPTLHGCSLRRVIAAAATRLAAATCGSPVPGRLLGMDFVVSALSSNLPAVCG